MNRYFAILFGTIIALLSGRTMAQQTSEQLGRGFHVGFQWHSDTKWTKNLKIIV
jgi:hypothetical protein